MTTNPQAFPTNCIVCGGHADTQRQFVDFNFSIDFYGAVYFCGSCVVDVMLPLGFTPTEHHDKLELHVKNMEEVVQKVADENAELRRVVNALRDINLNRPVVVDTDSLFEQATQLTFEEPVEDSGDNERQNESPEREPVKSTTVRRPKNVPDSSSDDSKPTARGISL